METIIEYYRTVFLRCPPECSFFSPEFFAPRILKSYLGRRNTDFRLVPLPPFWSPENFPGNW
eukprot:UN15696